MPFEFIQIPVNGQRSVKDELNKLFRDVQIASVRKEFVPNREDSFFAFCIVFLDAQLASGKSELQGGAQCASFRGVFPPGGGAQGDSGESGNPCLFDFYERATGNHGQENAISLPRSTPFRA